MPRKERLIQEIKQANLAYASGYPLMSDDTYHSTLWKPLFDLDPGNKNLYHTSNNPNLAENIKPHSRPIKGIRKAMETIELKPFLTRFKTRELHIEPKYDGVAIVKYTMPENKVKLLLSGDGKAGRDVTNFVPKILFPQDTYSTESMELMITQDDWSSSLGDNVRTTVSGYLASSPDSIPDDLMLQAVSHYKPTLLYQTTGSELTKLSDGS